MPLVTFPVSSWNTSHQLHCLFSTPKPACLTSPSPLLPTCSSPHYPENLLKIYHVLLDYKPSLLSSYANHMKSGQHLLCLVSSQLSTRAAFAIWSPLSFYGNCFLEGHPQLWLPKPQPLFSPCLCSAEDNCLVLRKVVTTSFLNLKPAMDSLTVF